MWWSAIAFAWPTVDPASEADPTAARIGRVLQTFDSGGFTYAELAVGEPDPVWIAGPLSPLSVGQTVATTEGVQMAAFHSRTLDRTFDTIWFVTGLRVMGAAPVPAGAEAVAAAPGTIAIAEVFARREALAGAEITVTGRVVRVSPAILGRRWVHLQDGTGLAAEGTHDLTVTTAAEPALGAVVVARGRVATDRDLGAGYRYAVLVEDAAVEAAP